MMDEQIKKWTKPELIVLVRNNPEEAVLTMCKGGGLIPSFLSQDSMCHSDMNCVTWCRDQTTS